MRASCTNTALGVLAVVATLVCGPVDSVHAQTAHAVVLHDVVIDGRLDEWPSSLERYPIRNHFQAYGPTDIDAADLDYSTDLSPAYRVAYDPDEDLLYVAVEVRDDDLVVGSMPINTDGCEVYVHGGDGPRPTGAPMQYAMVPGGGAATGQAGQTLVWPRGISAARAPWRPSAGAMGSPPTSGLLRSSSGSPRIHGL
jgi:hypothetical protein